MEKKPTKRISAKSTTVSRSGIKKVKDPAVKKLKLLITVVDRSKALFYVDLLEQFEINMQTVVYGSGTASSTMLGYLGLNESDKAVILSSVREDNVKTVLETLEEKFEKVKNGKGIAFTVSMKSVIGVSVYSFLSNNQNKDRIGSKKGESV